MLRTLTLTRTEWWLLHDLCYEQVNRNPGDPRTELWGRLMEEGYLAQFDEEG